MEQLISKFQRTSVTPRNFILMNTPKYAVHTAKFVGDIIAECNGGNLPSLEVEPNCFEVRVLVVLPNKAHTPIYRILRKKSHLLVTVEICPLLARESGPAWVLNGNPTP